MKNSDSSDEDEIGEISKKQIIDSWARGNSPKQIADELRLPIKLVCRILKNVQKEFIKRKQQ